MSSAWLRGLNSGDRGRQPHSPPLLRRKGSPGLGLKRAAPAIQASTSCCCPEHQCSPQHTHTKVAASLALPCLRYGCGWLQASGSLPTVCSWFHVFAQSLGSSTSQGGTAEEGPEGLSVCHLLTALLQAPCLSLHSAGSVPRVSASTPVGVFFARWVPGLVSGLTLEGGHGKW